MNQNTNGGVIYEYGSEYIVRGVVSTQDVQEMAAAVIKTTESGMPVTLEDVADVRIGAQQPKLGLASERGKPAVLLTVTKQPNTGTIELTERLDAAIADLQKNLPADVHVSTDIFRQATFIENSINNVKRSLYEGAIFVVIVLFVFLANVRTTIISLITLPLSLLVTILVLDALGLSLNTMSLGGMAIAIGSLVDDAIVDVENVWKHLRENRALPPDKRLPVIDVVFNASKEVRMGAYADSELDPDHHRQLRAPLLPQRHGRQDAHSPRNILHRSPLRLDHRGPDPDSRALLLPPWRQEAQLQGAQGGLRGRVAQEALP